MASILIGYDLNKQGQDYEAVIERIKALSTGTWWHCLDSTWIIKTSLDAVQVRDALQPYLDNNDELLVMEVTGTAAAWWLRQECGDWLINNL